MSETPVRLVRVTNPLVPAEGRESRELAHTPGQSLRGYLVDARLDSDEVTVSLNGAVVSPENALATIPRPGDCIVVAPRVAGGGLVKTLANLAVLATAVAVGALLTPALGATVASLLAGAVSTGGALLVSAIASLFAPAQKQSTPSYAFDGPHSLARSGSPIPKGYGTFQWGGNIIASFIDVEGKDQYLNVLACYGFGPARAITNLQLNNKPIAEYENVQFYLRYGANNQTPIPSFNRIVNGYPQAVQCLAGQPVIVPGTGVLTQAIQVDIQFPSGIYYHTNDGNIIEAVITYLVEYSVSGANAWQPVLQPLSTSDVVSYDSNGRPLVPHAWAAVATDQPPTSGIVYALDDGPHTPGDPWTGNQTVTTYQPNGNHANSLQTFHGQWEPTDVTKNQILVNTWTAGYQDYVGANTQACYNRTSIYGLAPGKYDVRITKYGSAKIHDDVQPGDNFSPYIGQDMWVHSVNEIAYQDLSYPNMVLIGVRALATGQLAGSNLNLTATITHGLRTRDLNLAPAALSVYEEDNPACVAADMMLDRLYGGGQYPGIQLGNLNRYIDEWLAWARLNDNLVDDGNGNSIRRHVFNGVFDASSDLWSSLGVVTQMSRAAILPIGRDYGVFVDAPDTPVQIFSAGNTVLDSFTETWLELDARANQVEIEFADSTRNYKQDNPLVYMDPLNQNAGVTVKNVRINAKGVTLPAQAWHLARFRERNNQYLLRSGTIACDVDALACRPGNVIILQNDVPQWGWGGRTLPGSTATTLLMDRNDLAFAAGTNYSVILLFPALQRYSGTVTSATTQTDATGYVTGVLLNLSSFDGEQRVTRAVFGASDCLILSAQSGGVLIQPIPGFTPAAGQLYALYDTDVMVTAPVAAVSAPGGAMQTVTLSTPLPQAPEDFSVYFYGATGSQKLARVANIRKLSDFRARLDWVDYDDRCYVDATPAIGETILQTETAPGVSSLLGQEVVLADTSGNFSSRVKLSWVNGRDTAGVVIYAGVVTSGLTVSGGPLQLVDRLTGYPTSYTTPGSIGQATQYKVVGFDLNDVYANFAAAPSITVSAYGVGTNLLQGSTFQSGFAYWNLVSPRFSSDALNPIDLVVPGTGNDGSGQATYTVVSSSAITAPITLLTQAIDPSLWAVGEYLMLSAYFGMTVSAHGQIFATVSFVGGGTTPANVYASLFLGSSSLLPARCNGGAFQIPAGTTALIVQIGVSSAPTRLLLHGGSVGGPLDIPGGTVLSMSHLQLEPATAAQTAPSPWSDTDVAGLVRDLFQLGSSTGLRAQGSAAPTAAGAIGWNFAQTSIEFFWNGLTLPWPDGGTIAIATGNPTITGLAAGTTYYAYIRYNVFLGTVSFVAAGADSGSPQVLFSASNAAAALALNADGWVNLTPGGLAVTTGTSGTPTGNGSPGAPVVWKRLGSG